MSTLRKILVRWLPHVIWAVAISLGYSVVAYACDAYLKGVVYAAEYYYYKGLLLLIPLGLFAFGVKKAKRLWQYLLFSLVCLACIYIAASGWLFIAISVIVCLVWGANRIQRQLQLLEEELPEPCLLEEPNNVLLLLPLVCFWAAGHTQQVLFQKMAVFHFVYLAVLLFMHAGLVRFEEYVRLCELNANVPSRRILETGTRIFVCAGVLVLLLLVPVINTQYRYVSTVIEWNEIEAELPPEEQEKTILQSNSKMDLSALDNEKEPWIDLSWLANLLEQVAVVACWFGGAYLLLHWLYAMVVHFNKTQIEREDVIESTLVKKDDEVCGVKHRHKLVDLFDFSEAMRVRRRYKRALKRYRPNVWQTPTEIEQMAQLQMPELHAQYEKVRYGRVDD